MKASKGSSFVLSLLSAILIGGCSKTDSSSDGARTTERRAPLEDTSSSLGDVVAATATTLVGSLARATAPGESPPLVVLPTETLDFTGLALPVTAGDFRQQFVLGAKLARGSDAQLVRCVEDGGFVVGQLLIEMLDRAVAAPRSSDFADPDDMRVNGYRMVLTQRKGPIDILDPVVKGMSVDEAARFRSTFAACSVAGPQQVNAQNILAPFRDQWSATLQKLESTREVADGWNEWKSCMAKSGYSYSSETAYFGYVDSQVFPLMSSDEDAALRKEIELASVDATCLEPVVTARIKLRSEAREKWLGDHATELELARKELAAVLTR